MIQRLTTLLALVTTIVAPHWLVAQEVNYALWPADFERPRPTIKRNWNGRFDRSLVAWLDADPASDDDELPLVSGAAEPPTARRRLRDDAEPLPPPNAVDGDFPALPPSPYADDEDPLPPLEEELWLHGGAHLYEPGGDRRNWPTDEHAHYELLREPADAPKPRPLTLFQEFLGPDPPHDRPRLHWMGPGGYSWEPRFVGSGFYRMFGFAFRANNREQNALGHHLIADLDLRLTGTERFHVQFRPLGRKFTGGSYYQFSDPEGYVDNSTGEPDRYWFEGEVASIFGSYVSPFAVRDYHFVVGKFPFHLHNTLLLNDDILGAVISKNTMMPGCVSNLNLQVFAAVDDVDLPGDENGRVYGVNATVDYRLAFIEATYAFAEHSFDATGDAHYVALSSTKLFGPTTLAGRALLRIGDRRDGQLFVFESNRTRVFDHKPLGVEKAVFYCNAFLATEGWSPIAIGNFNRLTAAFEVSPLVQIATGQRTDDVWGAALGVQLFRHHEDESLIPEIAFEAPADIPVWGFGLRYLRKTGRRCFLEVLGVINTSEDPRFERKGIFVSETIVF